jgi:hypothetical protein
VLNVRVMGVPVRFRTETPELADAVARRFGTAAAARGGPRFADAGAGADRDPDPSPVEIGLVLAAAAPGGAAVESPLRIETPTPDRLVVRGGGVFAEADAREGYARAEVPAAAVDDEETLGAGVLDTLVLFLVTARDRCPVHAACVVRDDRALLLAAPGGTGKSTLAYALSRAGCRVVSDDAVYLQSDPDVAVWGMGMRLSLPPDAAARFPELAERAPARRADGRMKLLVPLPRPAWARPAGLPPGGLCLLRRGGEPEVACLDPTEAVDRVAGTLEPGFDRFAAAVRGPLRAVAGRGAWQLTLPPDPRAAAELVLALRP